MSLLLWIENWADDSLEVDGVKGVNGVRGLSRVSTKPCSKGCCAIVCVGVTDMSREGREISSVTQVVVVVRGKGA